MTNSRKLWLACGTTLILLALCGVMLAVQRQSLDQPIGSVLILLVAAGVIVVASGMIVGRNLVAIEKRMFENEESRCWLSAVAAGFGAYFYDLESRTCEWSPELKRIWGLPADAVLSRERIRELIHPHDRELFQRRLAGMFLPPEGEPFECEYRIVRPDGEERWLRDRGQFSFAGRSQSRLPVHLRGMIWDITEQKRGEEVQHESELRHRAAFEGSAAGMCQSDPRTGHLLRVNHRFCQMLGYSNTELVNLPCQDILHPADSDSMFAGLTRLRSGEILEFRAEIRFLRKDGSHIWGDVSVNFVPDLVGRPERMMSVIKDISERKQAEERVRDAERRLRAFLDNSSVYAWMKDEEGRYVFLSKNYERHLGLRSADLLGKTDFDYWPREAAEQFRLNDQSVLATGRATEFLEQGQTSDGKRPWWLCHKFPYQDEYGKRFVGGLAVDLTEHKRTEEALRESKRHLALVLQGANVGLFDWDFRDNQVRYSREWKSQLGFEEDEISNRYDEWESRVHPDDLEKTMSRFRSYLQEPSGEYEVEYRMRHKNGSWRWILGRGTLIDDPPGKPVRLIGIALDITSKKEVNESLRESEERLRLANEAANIGTFFGDLEGDRIHFSPELCAMLGVKMGIERKLDDGFQLVHPEDLRRMRAEFNAAIDPAGSGRQRTEIRIVRPGGEVRWLVYIGQIEFRDTACGRVPWRLIGACLDITDRKKIEQSLRRLNEELEERVSERTRVLYAKQERLQAILNNNFNAILTVDRQGQVESVNLAAVKMFGYSVDKLIGQNFERLVPPPESQTQYGFGQNYLEMGLSRMTGDSLEVVARRQDGSAFPAELAVSEIEYLGLYCVILRELSEQKRLERDVAEASAYEQRRIGQDLHDSVGQQLTALTMLAQDFVESLSAETQASVQSQRDLGLSTPQSALSRLSPLELADRLRRNLQKALEEVRSISRSLNPVPIDSQGLMVALTDLIERMQLQSRVSCTFDCPHPVSIENVDTGTHLFHIAQEALSNALRHAHARHIRISLWHDDLQISLRIQDDGCGISWPLPQPQGIGLRIMKSRADMIRATLTIDRAQPQGTVVICTLTNGTGSPV